MRPLKVTQEKGVGDSMSLKVTCDQERGARDGLGTSYTWIATYM